MVFILEGLDGLNFLCGSTSMCLCASAYLVFLLLRLRLQKESKFSSMQLLK